MTIANTDKSSAFKLLLLLNNPKLTPLFQVSNRLKKRGYRNNLGRLHDAFQNPPFRRLIQRDYEGGDQASKAGKWRQTKCSL